MKQDETSRFEDGMTSQRAGVGRGKNPYSRWTSEWIAWLAGWNVSAQENSSEYEPLAC
jgi:hypothetical protein